MKLSVRSLLPWLIALVMLLVDQITKHAARVSFSLPDGNPDYFKFHTVIGEWFQFRLVYNFGAAFGMKPQGVLPFLNPTLFYTLFSLAAMVFLGIYYRHLKPNEFWPRLGVALIFSGAVGNLIDRLALHKVTDFIDVGIPGVSPRWPTFNIADSCVCVGMGILL
ncbi:MAG TPA: signal peptidase II, partial [Fibrobacteres bacterium]|nr:signal peptidase II [Fibrobacterota bacterium]